MNSLSIIAATAILFGAAGALAQEGAVPERSAEDEAAAKQEKKVCKTEKLTGSLTRVRRICLTRSEWSRLAEGTQKNVDAITRDANQVFANNPGAAVQGGGM